MKQAEFEKRLSEVAEWQLPDTLVSVRRSAVDCGDCGQHCPRGRETEAKLHKAKIKNCWRKKCVTCGYFQNPFTGKFDLRGVAASARWHDYLHGRERNYYIQSFRPTDQPNGTVLEDTDTERITCYPHSEHGK